MILIKDLGWQDTNKSRKRVGIFKCEQCETIYTLDYRAIKSRVCLKCSSYKHGYSRDRVYGIYKGIIRRCYNEKYKEYANYGGRGIKVCEEWLNNRVSFFDWAMKNGYSDDLSIDRIDNDGNYEPNNCRWVDDITQAKNKRLLTIRNNSGFRGVGFNKNTKKWRAKIMFNGKIIHLGLSNCRLSCAYMYDEFVIKNDLGYPLNFIKDV